MLEVESKERTDGVWSFLEPAKITRAFVMMWTLKQPKADMATQSGISVVPIHTVTLLPNSYFK